MKTPQPPTRCLEHDHRRLDAILGDAERAAQRADVEGARKNFAAFAAGLARHIDVEEGVLFPELEGMHPGARGPTSVMRGEHRELRALLGTIERELAAAGPGWGPALGRLKELLGAHDTKEERVLYPMADAAASRAGRSEWLAEALLSALTAGQGELNAAPAGVA